VHESGFGTSRRPSRRAFAPAHYESAASLMHHKAKTQRPHPKSRHGSSFSAIKIQRLPNRLLAAHESCAYCVCCVCHARSILSSSFSKLAPFHVDRNWHRALLADAGFVLHGHYGPALRLQEIRFDDLLQLLTAVLGTKPTSKPVRRMSAIRGKPDVTQTCRDDRL
jgi:hypothetical protein